MIIFTWSVSGHLVTFPKCQRKLLSPRVKQTAAPVTHVIRIIGSSSLFSDAIYFLANVTSYTDDTVLVADTEDDLQRLLYNLHLSCFKFNINISIHKSKSMTISKELNAVNFKLMAG
jgi:hypothetical protein